MDYSLIAVDMDGTLLNDSAQISAKNLDAIERISKSGVQVVPVTGRTYYEIPLSARDCPYIRYFVYSNGAGIYDKERGTVYSSTVPVETASAIFSILDSYETFIEIYSDLHPWADITKLNESSFEKYKIDPRFRKVILSCRRGVENIGERLKNGEFKAELFDVFFSSMGERGECYKRLRAEFPEIEITSSMGNNLEIMNGGTHKGSGLLALCRMLSAKPEKVIAVGDSGNDLRLFESAGRCCAVSNACAELKEMATDIICSNNENVMVYLEKNIL